MEHFTLSIFQFIVLIFSVMVHEIAHGAMAEYLGDPTARLAGRLTLNPIRHIDPFGSILLPALLAFTGSPILLGWAKPVPYNPLNLTRDPRHGPLKVALAGPLSNLALLAVFGLIIRFAFGVLNPSLLALFGVIAYVNVYLAVFNLVPIPPLDGAQLLNLLLPPRYTFALQRMGMGGIFLVFLFVFLFSGVISKVANFLFLFVVGPAGGMIGG